jgi:hypothetical protein
MWLFFPPPLPCTPLMTELHVLWVYALPGETVLVDVLFLSQIGQTQTEFGQSPRWSPFFLWKAWKPCPGRVWYLLIMLRYIQFELCPHKDDALKFCLFPSLFLRLFFF